MFEARKGSATEDVGALVGPGGLPLGVVVVGHVGSGQRCGGTDIKAEVPRFTHAPVPEKCRPISLLSPAKSC